jgi:hypothetical protein
MAKEVSEEQKKWSNFYFNEKSSKNAEKPAKFITP